MWAAFTVLYHFYALFSTFSFRNTSRVKYAVNKNVYEWIWDFAITAVFMIEPVVTVVLFGFSLEDLADIVLYNIYSVHFSQQ